MANLEELLTDRLSTAFAAVAGEPVDPVVHRSQHADYQADAALGLARQLGRNPRQIADEIVAQADLADICETVTVSGPGFLNLTFRNEFLGQQLAPLLDDDRLGIPETASPQIIPIDYSAPNTAKEMHVGHLRSTVIGDAAVRLLSWLGHTPIKQNHVGDWGTPFGMLIEHMLDLGETEATAELSVGDLNTFYRGARVKFDSDAEFADRARRRVVLLQSGDGETRRLWRILVEQSEEYFLSVYRKLDVLLTKDDFAGESMYNDDLADVVAELRRIGLLVESDGAQCVFPPGFTGRDEEPLPLIVQKSDGGYGYASTDLATIRYRIRQLHADRMLYVVGLPQSQHFAMIFAAAKEAGWLADPVSAEHIAFGSILGTDGKMLRTRAGDTVRLVELLDEAVARADAVIAEKNPQLTDAERAELAQAVGIGAIKYADLSTDRTKDYIFDYDRMLSFDGNTAPYLQYARARICSIFRKADVAPPRNAATIGVSEPEERELALTLLAFGGVVAKVEQTLEFHRLAGYLHTLAATFTKFYERHSVLKADGAIRDSRLALCDLTARTLATGLSLLGIQAPDRL